MKDPDCVAFLQWALPRLRLHWGGFRKVRRQVCKRIARHIDELGLPDLAAYRRYLDDHVAEWQALEHLCPITISRFYRDDDVCEFLGDALMPALAESVLAQGRPALRAWSVGCASGEEPYTLMLLWRLRVEPRFPSVSFSVLATDVVRAVLERARVACYRRGSLARLPPEWIDRAFERADRERFCLRAQFRAAVEFRREDLRRALPPEHFHLILCRNLAFTYYDAGLQRETLARLTARLLPGGALVIGRRESLPADVTGLCEWAKVKGIYRKCA